MKNVNNQEDILKGVLCEDYLINQAGHPMLGGENFCKNIMYEEMPENYDRIARYCWYNSAF